MANSNSNRLRHNNVYGSCLMKSDTSNPDRISNKFKMYEVSDNFGMLTKIPNAVKIDENPLEN